MYLQKNEINQPGNCDKLCGGNDRTGKGRGESTAGDLLVPPQEKSCGVI